MVDGVDAIDTQKKILNIYARGTRNVHVVRHVSSGAMGYLTTNPDIRTYF